MNIQNDPNTMNLSRNVLVEQNRTYHESGGTSSQNRNYDFKPAFLDETTETVHLARFADGRIAPMHLLEGLPDELVANRSADGTVLSIRKKVIAGFTRHGIFYTREQAAKAVAYFSMNSELFSVREIR